MTTTTETSTVPFLEALRRIEELTRRIRQGGIAQIDTLEADMAEVRASRSALTARIAAIRAARS